MLPPFYCFDRRAHARVRLFCFPHAGGTASAYRKWSQAIAPQIELRCAALPGRGGRVHEAPASRIDQLLERFAPAVLDCDERPCWLFGHSMGGLIAFELARELQRLGRPCGGIIVSAVPPPDHTRQRRRLAEPKADDVVRWLCATGGLPPGIAQNPEALAAVMPSLLADLALVAGYEPREATLLQCSLSAMGGISDPMVDHSALQDWRRWTTGAFSFRVFAGTHFYARDAERAVLSHIERTVLNQTPVGV